jgi:TolB protein
MHLVRIVLVIFGCLVPGVTEAAFPGTNGRIAFGGQGVFSINPDGSGLAKVADGAQPAWSPDDTKIAFVGRGIGVVNADGTGERQLTTTTGDFEPAWSPDGQQIVFASQTAGPESFV